MHIRRLQLFEWNDLPWIPEVFRSLLTDFLNYILMCRQPFLPGAYVVLRALKHSSTNKIIDLCSGQGGPWPKLLPLLNKKSRHTYSVTFTDKYPISPKTRRTWDPLLRYFQHPVDATAVPEELKGTRTIFNGFHHFNEKQAQTILSNAVDDNQSIVIFEMLQRNWKHVLLCFLIPIMVLIVTPRIGPFRTSRIILTYVIPIAPLLIFWDTMVSILRCYHPSEFMQMTSRVNAPDYHWETGSYNYQGIMVTYYLGYPKNAP